VAYSTGLPDGSTTVNTYSFRGNWWDSEAQMSRTFWQKHRVTLGTEIIDNLRQDQGSYTPLNNGFVAVAASSTIWALYGQDEFAITQALTLSAGIRYDHYADFGGTTNPRLGLIYHVTHPTTLKLLYGTAFRAPEPFELMPDDGTLFDDNLQLQPETIRSVEGVVEQQIGPHFTISGGVFQNWIDNLITLETNPTDGQSIYRNAENASATGVEVELGARMPNGMEGRASYSYTNTVQSATQEALANSPQHLGKLNLSLPVARRRLTASMDAQYTSPAQTLAGNTVSGFAVFNATMLGHTLGKHLDVSASAYNIFDKKYFDPGRPEDPEDSIAQDGRNFRVKITARF
jgi:outer membrane receptor for ferrienterochelin and colicins